MAQVSSMLQFDARPSGSVPLKPTTPSPVLPAFVKWCIVIARNGKHNLYFLEMEESLSGSEVVSHIFNLYYTEAISLANKSWHLFHTPVVDTAELELVKSAAVPSAASTSLSSITCTFTHQAADPEAQYQGQRVAIVSQSRNRGLTEACLDPATVASISGFAARHREFVIATDASLGNMNGMGWEPFKAILVRPELTRTFIALSMITLFLFLAAGLMTG